MLFQIWGRGDRTRAARVEMRALSIMPYKDLPLIDAVYVVHESALSLLSTDGAEPIQFEITSSGDGMLRHIDTDGSIARPVLVELDLPSTGVLHAVGATPQVSLDGVRAGYFSTSQELLVVAGCRPCYYLGYVFSVLSIILIFILYISARSEILIWRRLRIWTAKLFTKVKRSMANFRFRYLRSQR